MTTCIGYVRCSTREQTDLRLGLDAQHACIAEEAARRGWDVVWVEDAAYTGSNMRRPGLRHALAMLKGHRAQVLLVCKWDRLSRDVYDFAGLLITARKQHWAIVALDLDVDTTTPEGEAMATNMMTWAQLERKRIGQRTHEALEVKRLRGDPGLTPPATEALIMSLRAEGESLRSITQYLNESLTPTANGGREWYLSTVARIVRRQQRQASHV